MGDKNIGQLNKGPTYIGNMEVNVGAFENFCSAELGDAGLWAELKATRETARRSRNFIAVLSAIRWTAVAIALYAYVKLLDTTGFPHHTNPSLEAAMQLSLLCGMALGTWLGLKTATPQWMRDLEVRQKGIYQRAEENLKALEFENAMRVQREKFARYQRSAGRRH